MSMIYNILLVLIALPGLIFFLLKMAITGKYRHSFFQKLGFRQQSILRAIPAGRRVWIHAVSVGEVTAAAPIVAALKKQRPDVRIILSTSTETGQGMAKKLITLADAFIYFPLDIPFAINRMLDDAHPDVFALVETELWPNFLGACKKRGIKTVMVNGRISPRSFVKYRRTRFFWKSVLQNIDEAGVISRVDATRIGEMGMPQQSLRVMGNAKYDGLAAMASPELQADIAARFGVRPNERFWVAGSTHPGEEKAVMEAYRELLKTHPDVNIILVPRHIERTREVISLLARMDFNDIITVTQMKGGRARQRERIIVVDVIGELFMVYSLATVVFCGGSLVPRGGQNILEAAAWGKVVFYGPSMDDFSKEAELLEDVKAGIRIHDAGQLLSGVQSVLDDPEGAKAAGDRGKAVVHANMGASAKYAAMIGRFLE